MLRISHLMDIRCRPMVQDTRVRNPADFPILGLLHDGPAHGYELCSELRERLGAIWTLRTSHIYALLAGLERDGLVCHERVDQETRPAKKVFSITDKGKVTFLAWVESPVLNVRHMRLEFLAKLHFARLHSPTALGDLIDKQLSVCRNNARYLQDKKQRCKTQTELEALDFRLAMVEAIAAWLTRLRTGGNTQWGKAPEGPAAKSVRHRSSRRRKLERARNA